MMTRGNFRTMVLGLLMLGLGTSAPGEDAIPASVAEDLRHADPAVRVDALDRLTRVAAPETLDAACRAYAGDKDEKVVIKAAWAIAQIHSALDDGTEPEPRWKAAWEKVATILREGMLKHRENEAVALATLRAIAEMGDPTFVNVLANDLWKVKMVRVVHGRIMALGCIRDKTAVDELMDLLYVGSEEALRIYAVTLRWAIKRLTGEEFGDRIAAKKWWKEHRAKFEFAPVSAKERAAERRIFERAWDKALDDSGK